MNKPLTALAAGLALATASSTWAATPSPAQPDASPRIVLRADSNRDGRIDLKGQSDQRGKGQATVNKGALVLPNIDDDASRCASLGLTEARQACFDGADDVINGDDDLKDLAELRTVPQPNLPDGVTATLALEGAGAAQGRLFVGQGSAASGYAPVTASTVFTAAQLRKGLTFKLEAKTFARDLAVWDGTFTVALTAKRGAQSATDRVKLRVAPLLTFTHAHEVEKLVTSIAPGDAQSKAFFDDLKLATEPLGIAQHDMPPAQGARFYDEWAQDYFEPMYASVPAAGGGVHGMQVMLRSEQFRQQQLALFALQGKDVAVAAVTLANRAKMKYSGFDSMGNLETIPRIAGFSAGRHILGGEADGSGPAPAYKAFLEAQQVQAPLMLDTGWLLVGHVDEFISFLPAATPLGFRIAVGDPQAALTLVQAAVDAGLGDVRYSTSPFERSKTTLAQLLVDPRVISGTAIAKSKIDANLARVLQATGATEADVVRIPVLYSSFKFAELQEALRNKQAHQALAGMPERERAAFVDRMAERSRRGESGGVSALYPSAINWVVLDGAHVAAAKQHAPLLNGSDFMQAAITRVLEPLGYTPNWVEDYAAYHAGSGDVHCGSNTLRKLPSAWWR